MKRSLKRVIVGAIATGVAAASLSVGSAAAITNPPCEKRTDFVKVTYNNGHTACFANAGVVNTNMPKVTLITSGNNKIRFVDNGRVLTMDKWHTKRLIDGSSHRITRLRIF